MKAVVADHKSKGISVGISSLIILTAVLLLMGIPATHASGLQHLVRPGESLWMLSERYHTPIAAIRRANSLNRFTIYASEALWIPFSGKVHVVSRGETLSDIAGWYRTSVAQLQWTNGIYPAYLIYPGQNLAIVTEQNIKSGTSVGSTRVQTAREDEESLLARLVHSEAKGEPYQGQVAVAAVVLNRVRSPLFPGSISGVIYERGQFEPVMNGAVHQTADFNSLRAARDALDGWDPSWGALYFFNPQKTTNAFVWSRPVIRTIGKHRFTR